LKQKARQIAYAGVRFLRLFLVFQVYQSRSVACLSYAIFCYVDLYQTAYIGCNVFSLNPWVDWKIIYDF